MREVIMEVAEIFKHRGVQIVITKVFGIKHVIGFDARGDV